MRAVLGLGLFLALGGCATTTGTSKPADQTTPPARWNPLWLRTERRLPS